jgi:hypothetical protein
MLRKPVMGQQASPGLRHLPLPNGAAGCLLFRQLELPDLIEAVSITYWTHTILVRSAELARHVQWIGRGCKVNPGTSKRIKA